MAENTVTKFFRCREQRSKRTRCAILLTLLLWVSSGSILSTGKAATTAAKLCNLAERANITASGALNDSYHQSSVISPNAPISPPAALSTIPITRVI